MADSSDRHLCTSLSVSSWDIFTGLLPAAAILPSADCAHFKNDIGPLPCMKSKNECSDLAPLFSNTASMTSTPEARSLSIPLPSTWGNGSRSNYNPGYTLFDDQVGTGRRFTKVITRLEETYSVKKI